MTVECDASECESNANGCCNNSGLKIKKGQCVSGKANMVYLREKWRWAPGVELVKQRPNQSEYSKSMMDVKQNEERLSA